MMSTRIVDDGASWPELPPVEAYAPEERVVAFKGRARDGSAEVVAVHDAPSPVRRIDWASKTGRTAPLRKWFLNDWLPSAPTLAAGMGGIGKSLVLQTLSTGLVLARNYISVVPKPLRVLTWSCEDDEDELWRRQTGICSHFGCDIGVLESKLFIEPREGCDNTLFAPVFGTPAFTPLLKQLREQLNDNKIDVLVLDNLAHTFGASESDRHQTTKFVNTIAGLVRGRPFAPIFVGHTARSDGSEYSGSAAWENACRMRWYLGSSLPGDDTAGDERDPNVIIIAKRKANYTSKDYIKLRFENGIFVPGSVGGASLGYADRNRVADQVTIKGFDKLAAMGIKATDGASSPDFLPKQLTAKKLHQGHSKKELTEAMNRLMADGRFIRGQIGQYANRSAKFGLLKP